MGDRPGTMQGKLRRALRVGLVLLGGGLALLLATMSTSGTSGGATGPTGSAFGTSPFGAKAAFLLLQRLGHRAERRAEPMGDLRGVRLAFLLAPGSRLGGVDVTAIGEWVEAGGTLVYGPAIFEPDAELLREGLELPELKIDLEPETVVPLVGDWAPARRLGLRAAIRAVDPPKDTVVHLARGEGGSWALQISRGKGRIYLVDPSVFSNRGLKAADNALFLAALAARHAGGGTVVFEEFVHGYGDAVSVLSLATWPLRLAIATACLGLLVFAWSGARRLGPPSPEPAPPRRASIEQIEALAAYYASRKDRESALAGLAAWVGTAPPPPPARDAAFLAAARQLLASRPRPAGTRRI